MVWTRGNANGSAVVTQKAPKIGRDAAGLTRFCSKFRQSRAYLGVLTSGFHDVGSGESKQNRRIDLAPAPEILRNQRLPLSK